VDVDDAELKLEERFRKLTTSEKKLTKAQIKSIIGHTCFPESQKKAMLATENCSSLISEYNSLLEKDSSAAPKANPKKPPTYLDAQLHDAI
jgi:hypothetical protein